jgi:hypothetical protein
MNISLFESAVLICTSLSSLNLIRESYLAEIKFLRHSDL